MAIKPLEINSKEIHLMKPVTSADYSGKTVLTNSSWEYVELWLKRQSSEKSKRALFYWSQAKNFYIASIQKFNFQLILRHSGDSINFFKHLFIPSATKVY